jgi:hypothetical protein
LAIPKSSSDEDLARLDSLCLLFGIGFVLYDKSDSDTPNFEIRTRPQKHDPDFFNANYYLKRIESKLFKKD